jgi:hypothetical protein
MIKGRREAVKIAEQERIENAISELKAEKASKDAWCDYTHVEALTLAIETLQKHKDGLCITLPCKAGDTVYVDTRTFMYGDRNGQSHAEGLVTSFVFGHRNFIKFHIFSPYVNHYKVFKYPLSAFGKTVFLTREAAEAVLAKEESK